MPKSRLNGLLITVPLTAFLALALWANLDLTEHHAFLFSDEQMVYWNLRPLLQPTSFSQFVWQLADGGDHRYGRLFFNATALVSWLPFKLAGESGLIFAERMAQVLFLAAAYVLLVFTFFRTTGGRFLALALLIALPANGYYTVMPKPEPLLLLLLASFLYFHRRADLGWGRHWTLLGAAFGCKISALPFVLVFLLYSAWESFRKVPSSWWKPVAKGAGFFLLGWILAIPFLALAPLFPKNIQSYLNWTFFFTEHHSDLLSVNAWSWITFGWNEWLDVHWMGRLALLGVGFAGIGLAAQQFAQKKFDRAAVLPALLFAAGTLANVLIMLNVKRLWGQYLHVGVVAQLVGTAYFIERAEVRWARAGAALATAFVLLRSYPLFDGYRSMATRTQSPVTQAMRREYDFMLSYLDATAKRNGRRLTVLYDNTLYKPDSTPSYQSDFYWGQFKEWDKAPDVVAMDGTRFRENAPPPGSRSYASWKESYLAFQSHIITPPAQICGQAPCYREVAHNLQPLLVLVRADTKLP